MATTNRLKGFNIGVAFKPACAVTTTGANITLSGAQTIDGISVGSCERVLVQNQTDASENGIYLADSSTWIRAHDFDGAKDAIPGTVVYVDRGTSYGTSFWTLNSSSTATAIDIGTDDITVSRITVALAGVTAFSQALLALSSTTAWKSSDGLALGTAADANIGNSSTNLGLLTSTGLVWVGAQSWNKGGDLASANTLTLGSTGNYFDVTGGVTINSISAVHNGHTVGLHFDSTVQLTHSTALVLPTSANIATVAGDEVQFTQYTTAADYRCTSYLTGDGRSLGGSGLVPASTSQMAAENTSTAIAVTPGIQHLHSGHPKAVFSMTNTTSTSPTITATYSAIGTVTAERVQVGQYVLSWTSSLTNMVPTVQTMGSASTLFGLSAIVTNYPAAGTSFGLLTDKSTDGQQVDPDRVFFTVWGDI